MKKLKKLFSNPKAFWKDSRHNPKNKSFKRISDVHLKEIDNKLQNNLLSTQEKLKLIDKKLQNNLLSTQEELKLINKQLENSNILKPMCVEFNISYIIKNFKTKALFIKPLKDNLKYTIAINKNHKMDFFHDFLLFCHEELINIRYKYKGKIKKPISINEFWKDISILNKVDIRLDTSRSIYENARFWFRLELWDEFEEFYKAPTLNHISVKLYKETAQKHMIFKENEILDYSIILNEKYEDLFSEKIDLVFTWVNSEDKDWKEIYHEYKPEVDLETDAASTSRFLSRDELKYALRSWELYGNFINNIYIVSNCKPPEWLNLDVANIRWVYHEEILPLEILPTFSSHSIETSLHKIKNLSNYFIYSNDDVFLTRKSFFSDFYYSNGIVKLKLENYGNVNGDLKDGDPDYLNASRNSVQLLENKFKKTSTQLHTHSFQAMRIDLLDQMEDLFNDHFCRTRSNKFRSIDDINVASYLYPHYAYLSGNAIKSDIKTIFIQQNHNFKKKFEELIKLKGNNEKLPLSVCINDGTDSHLNDLWNKLVIDFLETFFNTPSKYEL